MNRQSPATAIKSATAIRRWRRGTVREYRAIRAAGPRAPANLATVVASTLAERVVVTENGRRKRITKLEAAVKQLVNRAAAGEARSMSLLLALVQTSEANALQAEPGACSADDALVLREIMRRMEGDAP